MTSEQMTTPPPKAPIDQQPKKAQPRVLLPKETPFPVGSSADILEADGKFPTLRCEGSGVTALSIHSTAKQALARAQADFVVVGEAESAVKAEQQNLMKSTGNSPVSLVRKDGEPGFFAVGQRFTEMVELAEPVLAKRDANFKESLARVEVFRDKVQKEIDATLVCEATAKDANLRQDIRNWLIGLGKDAGMAAINAAREGDLAVIHTVLTSPARVIGLSAKDIEMVKDFASRARHPTGVAVVEETDEVLGMMRAVEKAISKKRNNLTGYIAHDKAAANAALNKLRAVK